MKVEVKSIINVLSANFLLILVGIAQTFILPCLLEPSEYGYWSLYLLYVGYAGFIILGFCDGFYLKYGGEKYEEIDKNTFSGYHWILVVYLLLLLIVWISIMTLLIPFDKRYVVLVFIGIGGVLANHVSYFVLLNQATARFAIYARGHVIEKIVILIVAILCIFMPGVNSYYIIVASLIGKFITLLYFMYFSKNIIFSKPLINKKTLFSVIDNMRVGFTLTLSGVGAMLMTGFGRFVIEKQLGIKELGYYSLMFSISVLITQLIYAFSTVFFPFLRRIKEERVKYFLQNLDQLIINLSGVLLILYYPIRYVMEVIFPQYHPAMGPMLFLFPIILYQCRITLVYNTIYKVLRFEKQLLKNILIALSFCVIITLFLFNINQSKESIALATYISFFFWNLNAIWYYKKREGLKLKLITTDTTLSVIYILVNHLLGYTLYSFIITFMLVLLLMLFNFRQTIKILKEFKASM